MRIIFMGTPQPAADVLQELLKTKHEISLVVTRPDRPKGRGQKLSFSPVKEIALENNLPLEQPENIRDGEMVRLIDGKRPDVIVVVAYGKILPKEILEIPRFGCLNLHASLLPKYRGAAPIQWALLNGEKTTGITVMKIDETLDTGDILLQERIGITDDDNSITLSKKLFKTGAVMLVEVLEQIEKGRASYTKQDDAEKSYAPLLTKKSGEIDWRKSAEEIYNRIRALVSWPVANTYFKQKQLRIFQSTVDGRRAAAKKALPGEVIEIIKNQGFVVATGRGGLVVQEVQAEGKKRMAAHNFVLGHDVKPGLVLPN
ncbi:MAG: methionyl-tRNA formyltransferase [bacterium]